LRAWQAPHVVAELLARKHGDYFDPRKVNLSQVGICCEQPPT
jgi:hypothetical protein